MLSGEKSVRASVRKATRKTVIAIVDAGEVTKKRARTKSVRGTEIEIVTGRETVIATVTENAKETRNETETVIVNASARETARGTVIVTVSEIGSMNETVIGDGITGERSQSSMKAVHEKTITTTIITTIIGHLGIESGSSRQRIRKNGKFRRYMIPMYLLRIGFGYGRY